MVKKTIFSIILLIFLVVIFGFFYQNFRINHPEISISDSNAAIKNIESEFIQNKPASKAFQNPTEVKALYMTANSASMQSRVDEIINLINRKEINAIVVNVKDEDGGIFLSDSTKNLVDRLNENGIYSIARIVVFQDKKLAEENPNVALKTKSGKIWYSKGQYWVDPESKEVWDYNLNIADKALDMGFREVNFDYMRFPSDGAVSDIVYPVYNGKTPKEDVIAGFTQYLYSNIKKSHPDAVVSADIFAYTFLKDDLGIGQRLTKIAKNFDVICPMVYPSHYSPGDFGFKNPAEEPYQVILKTIEAGKKKLDQAGETVKIRPWLQDFNLGADYTPEMFRKEVQAVYDSGLKNGWMVWNPSNIYSPDYFLNK